MRTRVCDARKESLRDASTTAREARRLCKHCNYGRLELKTSLARKYGFGKTVALLLDLGASMYNSPGDLLVFVDEGIVMRFKRQTQVMRRELRMRRRYVFLVTNG